MRFRKYVSSASNMFIENRFNKFVVLVLAGILIGQQFILNNAFRDHKVFLVPPGLQGKTVVSGSSFDSVYLNAIGAYVASLLYSFTPSSVVGQYSELAALLTPDNYEENSKGLLQQAADYKENDVATSLQIIGIKHLTNPNMIEVSGDVTKYIASEKVETKRIKLEIAYIADNGMFKVKSIEEKK